MKPIGRSLALVVHASAVSRTSFDQRIWASRSSRRAGIPAAANLAASRSSIGRAPGTVAGELDPHGWAGLHDHAGLGSVGLDPDRPCGDRVVAETVAQALHVIEPVEHRDDELRLGLDPLERGVQPVRLGRDDEHAGRRAEGRARIRVRGELAEQHAGQPDPVGADPLGGRLARDDLHLFARVGERGGQKAADSTGPENGDAVHLGFILNRMTYSIVARDPATGELGVAVQSHWFAVGPIVPWAESGVGAVATQANVEPSYGPRALELIRAGATAPQALERLVAEDSGSAGRQVAVVDAAGRVAAHTGRSCMAFAGHVTGDGVSCQANIMADARVWPADAAHVRGDRQAR